MSSVSEDVKPVDGGPVTLINVFEVPVERIDTFIAQWRERAKIMSAAPGFRPRSCGWRRSPRSPDERPGCPLGPARQDGDAVGAPEDAGTAVAANPGPNAAANAGANADGGEPKVGTTKAPGGR